jgi:hypothetical protein
MMFPQGRRGMVGVLISTEAWTGTITEFRTRNVDVYNNVFINMAGCLDIWEGTVSFLQRQIIENIRFAHNTCIGMWTTVGNTSVRFVNGVYSQPFPINRTIRNVLVANNIFSVDPAAVNPSRWVRVPVEALPAFSYQANYWCASIDGIGVSNNNVVASWLPTSEPSSLYPEVTTTLRGVVSPLPGISSDARDVARGALQTNVGAYEDLSLVSVTDEVQRERMNPVLVIGHAFRVAPAPRSRIVDVYDLQSRLIVSVSVQSGEECLIPLHTTAPVIVVQR